MANLTNARRDLMKPGTILYVVQHSVHDNRKVHFARQIFSTLEEARAYLALQDEPGYIKKAQTVVEAFLAAAHSGEVGGMKVRNAYGDPVRGFAGAYLCAY